jgi:tRNA pseudouridine55 synthase
VVNACRRKLGQRRVGHAGTLDPDATGVLLVGLGRATRLLQFLSGMPKSYRGEVVLGAATTTLDAAGEVTGTWDMSAVTLDDARSAARSLTGAIDQVPPMVSAVKIGGKRLHELARAGVEVDRPPRRVEVFRFDVVSAVPGPVGGAGAGPVLAVEVDCSSGTYVRTLAADLGAALGGGAHLRRLRRLAVGSWGEGEAIPLDELGPSDVRSPAAALRDMAAATVGDPVAAEVRHGRVLPRERLGVTGDGPWAVLDPAGELLAVYRGRGPADAKPAVVLAAQDH